MVRSIASSMKVAVATVVVLLGSVGCSSKQAGATGGNSTVPSAAVSSFAVQSNVTIINGQAPPEKVTALLEQSEMMRTSDGAGNTLVVARGVRPPHSRSPIHVHEYGGTTCVITGQMTLYMTGMAPLNAKAGQCYYMPAGPVMSGVNLGDTASVLIDSFRFPDKKEPWAIVEPLQGPYKQFDGG